MNTTKPSNISELVAWIEQERDALGLSPLPSDLTGAIDPTDIVNNEKAPEDSKPWLVVLGEWQGFFFCLYYSIFMRRPRNREAWSKACLSLSYRILTGLKSASELALNGHEIQTFQLAIIIS